MMWIFLKFKRKVDFVKPTNQGLLQQQVQLQLRLYYVPKQLPQQFLLQHPTQLLVRRAQMKNGSTL